MKRTLRLCLVAMAAMLCPAGARAQGVTMVLTDLYGDKETVEIRDGMTVYLPQGYWYERTRSLVVCDEKGEPFYQMPLWRLGNIRYEGVTDFFRPPTDLSAYEEPGEYPWSSTLRWQVDGRQYIIPSLGEWTFQGGPAQQSLLTAKGKRYQIPMASTTSIELQDTVVGVSRYLEKMLGSESLVYRWAFFNGSSLGQTDYMLLNFYAAVPEEGALNYSLIVPTDEAFARYVDTPSFGSTKPRVLRLYYKNAGSSLPIAYYMFAYDSEKGEVGRLYNLEKMTNQEITNRLAMTLRSHTILHNRPEDKARGLRSGNEYYQALDGSVVHVVRDASGEPVAFQGAFQMANEQRGLAEATIGADNRGAYESPFSLVRANVTERREKGNGWIYKVDNVLTASAQSAYSALAADEAFGRFLSLCQPDEEVIRACGLVDESTSESGQQSTFLRKYQIFTEDNGTDYNLNFVGNNAFTLYVPTNEAIEAEMANGLPTWDDIASEYEACAKDEEGRLLNADDSLRLQTKCLRLVNFVKAHIHFGMEIADQLPFSREHNTTVVKGGSLATPKVRVDGQGEGLMTVTDETGQTRHIQDAHKNIFVRDIRCSRSPVGAASMNGITVDGYATGVIHQIDGVLKYNE